MRCFQFLSARIAFQIWQSDRVRTLGVFSHAKRSGSTFVNNGKALDVAAGDNLTQYLQWFERRSGGWKCFSC